VRRREERFREREEKRRERGEIEAGSRGGIG